MVFLLGLGVGGGDLPALTPSDKREGKMFLVEYANKMQICKYITIKSVSTERLVHVSVDFCHLFPLQINPISP